VQPSSRIYVAGHKGLVGSAIVRSLRSAGFDNLLLKDRQELDLTQQAAVDEFFAQTRPEFVFVAAAKVGGIHANSTAPASFLRDNLAIQLNVIDAAYRHAARRLLFLGSSCIYPRLAPQPMAEEVLLTGALEPTNEWYAIAKIAGLKMCEAYRKQFGFDAFAVMPTNLYGPGDNFDLQGSHVIPALIRKCHEARLAGAPFVEIWGTGRPRREFLHVNDLAEACVFLMQRAGGDGRLLNIGVGSDIAIAQLAQLVAEATGFRGELRFNAAMPDGAPRKLLDVSRIGALGWKARIPLPQGLADTYDWFVRHTTTARGAS
jgi:GDP-L-fucose synthase